MSLNYMFFIANAQAEGDLYYFAIGLLFVLAIYFLPGIIAFRRKKKNAVAIIITTLFFGWSVVGWVACLIWACLVDVEHKVVVKQESQ